jgi:3-hydroxybutyrate dehydrogenase
VTNEAQIDAGLDAAVEAFGHVDVLVSDAGVHIVCPLEEFKFAGWKRLLAIPSTPRS